MRYIALLRAINVGGHTVKMDRLRELFSGLGFGEVESFIASGNIIFSSDEKDSAKLESRIEAHLRQALGYEVGTFLRSAADLDGIAQRQAFAGHPLDTPEGNLNVTFLRGAPDSAARERLLALALETDAFAVHGREVYWLRQGRMSDAPFKGPFIEKAAGQPGTARNITTIRKLAEKYRQG
jgi:uncharacterized protein (DUF1697 family)